MSQKIHFQKLKCFSKDFTQDLEHDRILKKIKALLKTDESISDTIVDEYFECIETEASIPILANNPEIEKFITGDSELLLHDRYYFVNKEIWKELENIIYNSFKKSISDKTEFFKIAEDYTVLKSLFESKLLAFEAS
ncbi:MAG: hypothetical protein ACLFV6_02015 [Spirulinaceae cyanobacterium]